MSAAQRAVAMARTRGRDTRPMEQVCSLLTEAGVKFRTHDAALPGTPDIVAPAFDTIIFIQGCYWHEHGCLRQKLRLKPNIGFWMEKFRRARTRDLQAEKSLKAVGWNVMTVWECETTSIKRLAKRLLPRFAPDRRVCYVCTHLALLGMTRCARCRKQIPCPREAEPPGTTDRRRRLLGLCLGCGFPAMDGFKTCPAHREAGRVQNAAKYQKKKKDRPGTCPHCTEPVSPGRKRCARHLELLNADAKRRQAAWLEAGLCVSCGKSPAVNDWVRCAPCHAAVLAYNERTRLERLVLKALGK